MTRCAALPSLNITTVRADKSTEDERDDIVLIKGGGMLVIPLMRFRQNSLRMERRGLGGMCLESGQLSADLGECRDE